MLLFLAFVNGVIREALRTSNGPGRRANGHRKAGPSLTSEASLDAEAEESHQPATEVEPLVAPEPSVGGITAAETGTQETADMPEAPAPEAEPEDTHSPGVPWRTFKPAPKADLEAQAAGLDQSGPSEEAISEEIVEPHDEAEIRESPVQESDSEEASPGMPWRTFQPVPEEELEPQAAADVERTFKPAPKTDLEAQAAGLDQSGPSEESMSEEIVEPHDEAEIRESPVQESDSEEASPGMPWRTFQPVPEEELEPQAAADVERTFKPAPNPESSPTGSHSPASVEPRDSASPDEIEFNDLEPATERAPEVIDVSSEAVEEEAGWDSDDDVDDSAGAAQESVSLGRAPLTELYAQMIKDEPPTEGMFAEAAEPEGEAWRTLSQAEEQSLTRVDPQDVEEQDSSSDATEDQGAAEGSERRGREPLPAEGSKVKDHRSFVIVDRQDAETEDSDSPDAAEDDADSTTSTEERRKRPPQVA